MVIERHPVELLPIDPTYEFDQLMIERSRHVGKMMRRGKLEGTCFLIHPYVAMGCRHTLLESGNLEDYFENYDIRFEEPISRTVCLKAKYASSSVAGFSIFSIIRLNPKIFIDSPAALIPSTILMRPRPGPISHSHLDYLIVSLSAHKALDELSLRQSNFVLYDEREEPTSDKLILLQRPSIFNRETREEGDLSYNIGKEIASPSPPTDPPLIIHHTMTAHPASSGGPILCCSTHYLKAMHTRASSETTRSSATSSSSQTDSSYRVGVRMDAIKRDLLRKRDSGCPNTRRLFDTLYVSAPRHLKLNPIREKIIRRSVQISILDEYFREAPSELSMKVAIVQGLGGIGKTFFVKDFAYQHQHRYQTVYLIDLKKIEDLQTELNEIPQPYSDDNPYQKPRLIIIDGLTTLFSAPALESILKIKNAHVLITSRERLFSEDSRLLPIILPPFTLDEAVDYLKFCHPRSTDLHDDVAKELAARLDGFPLALKLAQEDVEKLCESDHDVLEASFNDSIPFQILDTLEVVWKEIFREIESVDNAKQILHFIATTENVPFHRRLIELLDIENSQQIIDLLERKCVVVPYDNTPDLLSSHVLVQHILYMQMNTQERIAAFKICEKILSIYASENSINSPPILAKLGEIHQSLGELSSTDEELSTSPNHTPEKLKISLSDLHRDIYCLSPRSSSYPPSSRSLSFNIERKVHNQPYSRMVHP